jgi:hypothetical protein
MPSSELSQLFQEQIRQIEAQAAAARGKKDSGAYNALSFSLKSLKDLCRETLQGLTRQQIEEIIAKLKKNTPLTTQEIETVRLWIVGDVDHYLKIENNYEEWLKEAERLIWEIQKAGAQAMDLQPVIRLQGLVIDLDRTAQDIARYLNDRERIQRFEKATDRKSTRLNSSHHQVSRMPSSA